MSPVGVQDGDPVLERETAPRLDQACVALREAIAMPVATRA